ncbi:MAG: hypothetical protein OSB09_05510 [Planctomycetota bacterium]|nr:hypothetical protein [Planctomycetota bacterium]
MSDSTRPQRDSRLDQIFSDESSAIGEACLELVPIVFDDPELEQLLIDLVQWAIDQGEGFDAGVLCCALILGEIRSTPSTNTLLSCLQQDDEILQRISTRSLQRIGAPAFDTILELLEDSEIDGEMAALMVECLEGISLHDLPHCRDHIETQLRLDLTRPQLPTLRKEATAIALSHLGVADAVELMEQVLQRDFPGGNAFILDALELLQEHPEGLKGHAEDPIEQVVRWLEDEIVPGGDLDASLWADSLGDPESSSEPISEADETGDSERRHR